MATLALSSARAFTLAVTVLTASLAGRGTSRIGLGERSLIRTVPSQSTKRSSRPPS